MSGQLDILLIAYRAKLDTLDIVWRKQE